MNAYPEWAERWMKTSVTGSPCLPLISYACHPPRLVESGEIYTEEKAEYLFRIASLYEEGRKKLYETALAKGTPMLEIVEKVFRYNCTLPEDFRRMTGWQLPKYLQKKSSASGVTRTAHLRLPCHCYIPSHPHKKIIYSWQNSILTKRTRQALPT